MIDFYYLKNPISSKSIGLAEFHSKIGYVPKKMFKSTISEKVLTEKAYIKRIANQMNIKLIDMLGAVQ